MDAVSPGGVSEDGRLTQLARPLSGMAGSVVGRAVRTSFARPDVAHGGRAA